jgi:sec-independent protein translocase protein TatC
MTNSPAEEVEDPRFTKSFLGHMEDLRSTLVRSAIALVLGMAVALAFVPKMLDILKAPLAKADVDPNEFLQIVEVGAGFVIAMQVMLWGGLLLSLPFIAVIVGQFVFPGLRLNEKSALLRGLGLSMVLLVGGVSMGYFITLPVALRVLLGINEWLGTNCEFVLLTDYVGFTLKLLIAFAVAFQLPVVVLILGNMGILTSRKLRDVRRHVIVGLLILAMILTPPDIATQLLMAVPMIFLYEGCIWVIWMKEKRAGRVSSDQ